LNFARVCNSAARLEDIVRKPRASAMRGGAEGDSRMGGEGAPVTTGSFDEVIHSWRYWWRSHVIASVDQPQVIADRREEARLSARYLFMLAMSAGIAILGLLLSSPAVVIGAMLLSPLMGPIMGLGFALATGDFAWLKQSVASIAIGTLLGVGLSALVVFFSPLQTVTAEIAARTRPNLFDLLVALFSALAGAYAMIRGQLGAVVGVAIATALMPPLAVVGFGIATLNWTVFSGALMLYFTNLLVIGLTAALMARGYGFQTSLSKHQTRVQTLIIVIAFIGLAVPLGFSLRQIAWEARATREIRSAVMDPFDERARLSQIDFTWDSDPIRVTATVLTPQLKSDAEGIAERTIARDIGKAVDVVLTQYRVGTSSQAAETAQLASARARQEEADSQRAEALAERLALISGARPEDVLIDREHRRALVAAQVLPGASLAAYRELERRIAATEPEWRIELKPPAAGLPDVVVSHGKPTSASTDAVSLIVWADQRIGTPLVLEGTPADTDVLAALLEEKGLSVRRDKSWRHSGRVAVRWAAPDDQAASSSR
jgi:uncharacterized hydrophobic protein (TIGR00271 family)